MFNIKKDITLYNKAPFTVPKFIVAIAMFCLMLIAIAHNDAYARNVRIKDIVSIEGVRENMLVGYGLVVGLNGSGDSLKNSSFTKQSLVAMLERLGVNTRGQDLKTNNVAAVMVSATLPPFANQGTRIDVQVSALGDASSLQGGTLLVTPLLGADGEVYAVSQGPVSVSGFSVKGDVATITRNIPTSGRISNGAIVEREMDFELDDLGDIRLGLHNPDFTTSRRIAEAINSFMSANIAVAENSSSVLLKKPAGYRGSLVDLVTDIEQLPVQPDVVAKVVIDENSGVIVMGEKVKISPVAIAQSSLTVKITESPVVSQTNPFARVGQTVVVPRSDIEVNQGDDVKLAMLDTGITLHELVTGLNRLGVTPRDIITILQAIKAAGALQADIETM